jgi:hypothetical protein
VSVTRLRNWLAAVALSALLSAGANAQPARGPSDIARALAEALIRGDDQAAAAFLTNATRPLFLQLRQQETALLEASKTLNATVARQFRLAEDRNPLRLRLSRPAVTAVEVAAERAAGASAFDLDVSLYSTSRAAPAHKTVWRAIEEDGAWRIELPSCTPGGAPILQKRLQLVIQATQQMSSDIGAGRYADLAQARLGLAATMRAAVAQTRQ